MDKDIKLSWEKFLNPDTLRTNLILASLFVTSFEMLKESIIGRISDFFTDGFNEKGWIISDKYQSEVLALNNSPLYASLEWLLSRGVISENDIIEFNKVKKCRNDLVHEIVNFISKDSSINPQTQFLKIYELLNKIETWWILNVEIPTNPDFDNKEVDGEGIIPGPVMTLRLLIDIALGTEEESKYYYNEFIKKNSGLKSIN